jgi:hypothetical protein
LIEANGIGKIKFDEALSINQIVIPRKDLSIPNPLRFISVLLFDEGRFEHQQIIVTRFRNWLNILVYLEYQVT